MRFDHVLRWNHRTLLAMTLGFIVVAACGPVSSDPPPDDAIEIAITTVGPGTVQQPSSGFVCRGDCTWTGPAEEATGFVAAPDGANAFVAWTGVCPTLDATCAQRLEAGDATTATFAPHALRLHLTGDGEGHFRIQGPEVDLVCTEDCAVGIPRALSFAITYFADGSERTVLDDWGGACAGAGRPDYCLVSVSGATDVSKTWRHPPVAIDDAYDTARNATLSVSAGQGVLANDIDTPDDTLTAERVTDATHGTLTLAPTGGFTYTPEPDFTGTDSFTYRARDAFGNTSNTATVTIAVVPVNRPPVARDDAYTTTRNGKLIVSASNGVLANDTDPDGDTLTAILVDDADHGVLALTADGSFTYQPDANFTGTDTFTYAASDGALQSEPATVTITVTWTNRPPVARDDAYATPRNRTLIVGASNGVLANDTDPDGDTLTAILLTDVDYGLLALAADGSFNYIPRRGFSGKDTFTYVASDGDLQSEPATVTIRVGDDDDDDDDD